MFGGKNRKKVKELRKQHEADLIANRQRQEELGEQAKKDIENESRNKLNELREQNEAEVEEEAKRNLKKVEQQLAELEKYTVGHRKEQLEWKAQFERQGEKDKAEISSAAKAEQAERQKEYEKQDEKLENTRKALNKARELLLTTVNEGAQIRTNMQEDHNEKTEQQRKEHHEKMLEANATLQQYIVDKQTEFSTFMKMSQSERLALQDKELGLKTEASIGGQTLLNLLQSGNVHDKFRVESRQLLLRFKTFKEAYRTQEQTLSNAFMEMRRIKPISKMPRNEVIADAVNAFNNCADSFEIPEKFKEEFEKPFDEIRDKMEDMKNALDEIIIALREYEAILKERPEDEEDLKTAPAYMKKQLQIVQSTMTDMNKLIRKFDIPASREMREEIYRQAKAIAPSSLNQITNGSAGMGQLKDE